MTTGSLARSGIGLTAAPAAATPSDSSFPAGPIGRTIGGRYAITRLLGEGGMGGVYEGEHLELGKRVAVKLVHALHARDPHVAARIKQEARSTGAIESEHIVQVFDAGEDEELGIYLVMELLKGQDLGSLLSQQGQVAPAAAAGMIAQAAKGLARAHAAGVVHRDLKPANVFLCARDDGSSLVKLVDFGIAKLVRDANQASLKPGLTQMGMAIGTPQYMSPEQAQGLATVDHRTDVYSLGAVLYEACVGQPPHPEMATYEQTIVQIVTRPAPRLSAALPDIDPELDRLCADMMAHDPNARPRDMAAVRQRLARIFPELEGGPDTRRSLVVPVMAATPRDIADDEEPIEIAGVRRWHRALLGVIAVATLLAVAGAVQWMRVSRAAALREAQLRYGIVESTFATVPLLSADVPAPPPPALSVEDPAPVVQVPVSAPPPKAAHAPAHRRPAPAHARPVGGTSESTVF